MIWGLGIHRKKCTTGKKPVDVDECCPLSVRSNYQMRRVPIHKVDLTSAEEDMHENKYADQKTILCLPMKVEPPGSTVETFCRHWSHTRLAS